jgi:hypothetical protein
MFFIDIIINNCDIAIYDHFKTIQIDTIQARQTINQTSIISRSFRRQSIPPPLQLANHKVISVARSL